MYRMCRTSLLGVALAATSGCAGSTSAIGSRDDAAAMPDTPEDGVRDGATDAPADDGSLYDVDDPARYIDVRRLPTAEVRQRRRPSCPTPGQFGCDVVAMRGATFDLIVGWEGGIHRSARNISISSYALDRYEVTVERFRRFVEAGSPAASPPFVYPGAVITGFVSPGTDAAVPSVQRPCASGNLPSAGSVVRHLNFPMCTWTERAGANERYPITSESPRMDWFTAQSFCAWDGGRIPTDAEWSYAAFHLRDGRPYPRRYPHGDSLNCSDAVVSGATRTCALNDTVQPVGSRSPEGLFYDLGGNLAEFVTGWVFTNFPSCSDGGSRNDPICLRQGGLVAVDFIGSSFYEDTPVTEADRVRQRIRPVIGLRCAYPYEAP